MSTATATLTIALTHPPIAPEPPRDTAWFYIDMHDNLWGPYTTADRDALDVRLPVEASHRWEVGVAA